MCLQTSQILPYSEWNWTGDEIVFDTRIRAHRFFPGTRKSGYMIDIREFLSIEQNAVIRDKVDDMKQNLSGDDLIRIQSRNPGAWDFRAIKVLEWFSDNIQYVNSERHYDEWMFPVETLQIGKGDCEDLSFALAAMLEAIGISPYCIRVALGRLHSRKDQSNRGKDHAWVMYQSESGYWQLIDPLLYVMRSKSKSKQSPSKKRFDKGTKPAESYDIDYRPKFVFNRHHLWRVNDRKLSQTRRDSGFVDYLAASKRHSKDQSDFWKSFVPGFAVNVHEDIYDRALVGITKSDLLEIKWTSFMADFDTIKYIGCGYDPREHFDFAYIDEGWKLVEERLQSPCINDFARAIHAIADFYAHSTYGYVVYSEGMKELPVYNPRLLSGKDLTMDITQFQLPGCKLDPGKVKQMWAGKIISGQWWRFYATIPDDLKEKDGADLGIRRCLPDHDQIAVDSPTPKKNHFLSRDPEKYLLQFELRRNAAIKHISEAYSSWRPKRT